MKDALGLLAIILFALFVAGLVGAWVVIARQRQRFHQLKMREHDDDGWR